MQVNLRQSPPHQWNLLGRIILCKGDCLPRARFAVVRRGILLATVCLFLISSCSTDRPAPAPQAVTVYSTSAAQPWLEPLYACAGSQTVISRIDDASSADILLRVGEPELLAAAAYQIDTEEILIVTQRQSPVQNLALEEARALFAGQGDPAVQVWVYSAG